MKNILNWIEEKKQKHEGREPRTMLAEYKPGDDEMEQTEVLRPKRYDILTGLDVPAETLETWEPNPFLKPHAEGGRIGLKPGGIVEPGIEYYGRWKESINIDGTEYGKITKPNDPNFGKYVYRGNQGNEYFKEVDDLKLRIEQGGKGRKFTGYSKEYLQTLEDIKKHVKKQGGAKKLYLVDLIEEFGDPSETGRDVTTEKRIKKALGDEEYKKLNKATGGDPRILAENKLKWNKLVRDVNRGDRPLMDLATEKRGKGSRFGQFLNPTEKKMYDKLLPSFRAIQSRVTQPRKGYSIDDIKTIGQTTTKNYNKVIKQYPLALETKAGFRPFDVKSSILSTLKRHSNQGGDLFKYISGDNIANIKIRDKTTNKILTYKNLNLDDPMFKEYVNKYDHKTTINRTKISNPLNRKQTINIASALEAGGDYMVLDHLDKDGVKGNPLKNLAVSTQKANLAGNIKGMTEAERLVIGRGLNLSLEDDIKRYSKYSERILTRSADPKFKVKAPTETLIDYHVGELGKNKSFKSLMH